MIYCIKVKCKRYSGKVGEPAIRDLYGVVVSQNANKGFLVTNSSFSQQAQNFAEGKNIELIDGNILNSLIKKHLPDDIIENFIPIHGKDTENGITKNVSLKNVIASDEFKNSISPLSIGLGESSKGEKIIIDMQKLPHLLISGATGTGKSVCLHSIITSIISKATPEEVKLVLVDLKHIEMNIYNGIPHLLCPIINKIENAKQIFEYLVKEILNRYEIILKANTRNIDEYNAQSVNKMFKIIVIIDELADLIMASKKEIETLICRLAQMGAFGLHVIISTQYSTTNVITNLLKAHIPSRIAFAVSSKTDSRVIIDKNGAERLSEKGDMLYAPLGKEQIRVQGCYISTEEINSIVNETINKHGQAKFDDQLLNLMKSKARKEIDNQRNRYYIDPSDMEDIIKYNIAIWNEVNKNSNIVVPMSDSILYHMKRQIVKLQKLPIKGEKKLYTDCAAKHIYHLQKEGFLSEYKVGVGFEVLMSIEDFEKRLNNR